MFRKIVLFLLLSTFVFGDQLKPPKGMVLSKGRRRGTNGLVGYWLMNEGSGNKVFDLSGNNITGTFGNTTSWLTGDQGPAIDFTEANDDNIGFGNPIILQSLAQVSVVCRFFPHATGSNDTLVYKLDNSNTDGFGLGWFTDNVFQYKIGLGGAVRSNALPTQPTANVWHTAVGVYDGANVVLYLDTLDNVSAPEAGSGIITNTAENLVFGMFSSLAGTTEYDGLIESVYIYNRALSESEIASIFRELYIAFQQEPPMTYKGSVAVAAAPAAQVIFISSIPLFIICSCVLIYRKVA